MRRNPHAVGRRRALARLRAFPPTLAALLALAAPAPAADTLHVERTVLLIRHGVRPPTHTPPAPAAIAPNPWPVWEVPDGYLTPHGAAAITLLAQFDRTLLSPTPGCPDISIYADVDERTLATGAAYAAGFAPGCNVAVAHAPTATDPLFSPPDTVDNNAAMPAMAQVLAAALTAPDTASLLSDMQAVLDPHSKRFVAQPETVSLSKNPATCRNCKARSPKARPCRKFSCSNIWTANKRLSAARACRKSCNCSPCTRSLTR